MTRLLIAAMVLFATSALAHDDAGHSNWIMDQQLRHPLSGVHCCSKDDCYITIAVRITKNGFLLTDTNELVPFNQVINNNHDQHYWRCDRRNHLGFAGIRCLIVPPQNM